MSDLVTVYAKNLGAAHANTDQLKALQAAVREAGK
jgi:hypothetical protein